MWNNVENKAYLSTEWWFPFPVFHMRATHTQHTHNTHTHNTTQHTQTHTHTHTHTHTPPPPPPPTPTPSPPPTPPPPPPSHTHTHTCAHAVRKTESQPLTGRSKGASLPPLAQTSLPWKWPSWKYPWGGVSQAIIVWSSTPSLWWTLQCNNSRQRSKHIDLKSKQNSYIWV